MGFFSLIREIEHLDVFADCDVIRTLLSFGEELQFCTSLFRRLQVEKVKI